MDRDVYAKLIAKLKTLGGTIKDVESATSIENGSVTPSGSDVQLRSENSIFKIGGLVIYKISVKLDGSGTEIPANVWKDIFEIPEGFRMKYNADALAIKTNTATLGGCFYYDSTSHKIQLRPLTAIAEANISFSGLMIGEVEADA